jgi:four helix bundle protein
VIRCGERNARDAKSSFEHLEVYQVAREFRKAVYRLTRRLPDVERFALADQIRRAAISLTNNIAEGHERYHYLDQIRFTLQSRGSLEELLDDLNICEDEWYFPSHEIAELKDQGWRVRRLIDGYIRYLRQQTNSVRSIAREGESTYTDHHDDSRFSI